MRISDWSSDVCTSDLLKKATAGVENPGAWSGSDGASGHVWAAVTVALRPAAGGVVTHTASGALASAAATVDGSAAITGRVASGSLQAGSAAITGAALRTILASGTLGAQASAVAGSASAAAAVYQPQGVNFDGTNDYLTRGGDLTGNADSKLVTGAFWFMFTASAPGVCISGGGPNNFFLFHQNPGPIAVVVVGGGNIV